MYKFLSLLFILIGYSHVFSQINNEDESNEISHPKIEALFTIDEETGMTGALNLSDTILTGKILLNLDTEEDDEICVGCAGGIDITISKNYQLQELKEDNINVKILRAIYLENIM